MKESKEAQLKSSFADGFVEKAAELPEAARRALLSSLVGAGGGGLLGAGYAGLQDDEDRDWKDNLRNVLVGTGLGAAGGGLASLAEPKLSDLYDKFRTVQRAGQLKNRAEDTLSNLNPLNLFSYDSPAEGANSV